MASLNEELRIRKYYDVHKYALLLNLMYLAFIGKNINIILKENFVIIGLIMVFELVNLVLIILIVSMKIHRSIKVASFNSIFIEIKILIGVGIVIIAKICNSQLYYYGVILALESILLRIIIPSISIKTLSRIINSSITSPLVKHGQQARIDALRATLNQH